MTALESSLRKLLERNVVVAREEAEEGAANVLQTLAVRRDDAYPTMDQAQRDLRAALRAKAKNLGEGDREAGYAPLIEEIAYEQWHRLLFARFLAENDLLMYAPGMPVSLAECAELATEAGADNGWDLAGRYAARMLPGIFRAEDPAAQVRLAREHRATLEGLVADLPREVFTSDDGLGWTYQFWQAKRKNEVNASGVKIGARELAPVTQLFTEDYMVRFLLENSLGAWWAGHHPESPLLAEMAYLRFAEDGTPAAGTFPGWPELAADVTVMDPCCGSGHFLTRAFHLLRQMRMEEEGLDAAAAGDAVLRDNLFGLELDERCVQIAAFALALEAWKSGGYRAIPAMQVACSGVPVAGQLADWIALAGGDVNLSETLKDLYRLFADAPTLGSLIDPRQTAVGRPLFAPRWSEVFRVLADAEAGQRNTLLAYQVPSDAATAALLLGQDYTLVATNVPYLGIRDQSAILIAHASRNYDDAKSDLATMFFLRCLSLVEEGGTVAIVSPQNWLSQPTYERFRRTMLRRVSFRVIAVLGERGFESNAAAGALVGLSIVQKCEPNGEARFAGLDASRHMSPSEKRDALLTSELTLTPQYLQASNPGARMAVGLFTEGSLLQEHAYTRQGIKTGDDPRFRRQFWEVPLPHPDWNFLQSTVIENLDFGGMAEILWWQRGKAPLVRSRQSSVGGVHVLGRRGVAVSQMRIPKVSLYLGDFFDSNVSPIVPIRESDLPALWAFCTSEEYGIEVKRLEPGLKANNSALIQVPFDLVRWQRVAAEQYPDGLPEPNSDDPTQWLFNGHPNGSEAPLQVAVARLLGYRWPEQPEADGLQGFADSDGIVPLSPVRGESPAADRLRTLLAAAYDAEWSPAVQERLLAEVGFAGRDLGAWLADGKGFFAQHAKLFHNRPFIWQIWDGARDGFSVLVNSHKLTRGNLEKLIYTYLGDWIARQEQARDAGDGTAETRLIKARELKAKLEAILTGEPPYDVYVRWNPLHEQPIGWDPDLNDGVRLNIRPFIEAGVLRAKFSVNWNKDRGDNPPGSTARQYAAEAQQAATNRKELPSTDGRERFNDLHLTRVVKETARSAHSTDSATGEKE